MIEKCMNCSTFLTVKNFHVCRGLLCCTTKCCSTCYHAIFSRKCDLCSKSDLCYTCQISWDMCVVCINHEWEKKELKTRRDSKHS